MWISKNVNLPDAVVSALKSNKLVIFAGAGVSKAPPSNYPGFEELAYRVAQQAGGLQRTDNEPVDKFLGRLKKQGPDVHRIVKEFLSNPESKPTDLHYALLSLFLSPQNVRIVTTNFDRHFSTATDKLFPGGHVEVYRAPALPLGNQFNGIVYLHGCVDQQPECLVLTDIDFGRAYLTEGWARRFLLSMFAAYTVLFIGYSHNDTVMQYLARGLPPDTPRFALTPSGDDEHWAFLGISPITYPLRDEENRHQALVEAVHNWSKRNKEGFLDQEERIRKILESPPPLDFEDQDYIIHSLTETPTARFFVKYAQGPEWLQWMEEKGFLKVLFTSGEQVDEIARMLAWWFAENYVCSNSEEGLALVQRQGQMLNQVLWLAIAHCLFAGPLLATETFAKWVAVLLSSAPLPVQQSNLLDYLLNKCRPEDNIVALILFEYLTRPYPVLEPYFSFFDEKQKEKKVDITVSLPGETYYLQEAWNKVFKPNLAAFAQKLEPVLTTYFQQAHGFLRAAGVADDKWDSLSLRRTAIEPHEQAHYPGKFDVLIDAARDVIEYFVVNDNERAQYLIERWASSNVPLLKRLAIHGVTESKYLTPDEKIEWLLKKGWLYAPGLKHEVFRLLQVTYPNADENIRIQVLDKAEQKSLLDETDGITREIRQYEVFNLLYWLSRAAPGCPLTAERFQAVRETNPDFKPREYPDLDMWTSGVVQVGRQSPITVDELLAKPPEELINLLLTFRGKEFLGPDREGLLDTVREATSRSFDWSWQLVEILKARSDWTTDLWGSIIGGWRNYAINEDQWEKILDLFKSEPKLFSFAHAIGELLIEGVKKADGGLPFSLFPRAEDLADRLWNAINVSPEENILESKDWVIRAISHPGGQIVEFWLRTLFERRSKTEGKWLGLPGNYRDYFQKVIGASSYGAEMGRVILTSQLHFLFSLDPDWTHNNILPLFDWATDKKRAQQAWHGYLWRGKWNEALLPDLLPLYEQSFSVLATDLVSKRDRFCQHLAGIAIYSSIDPLRSGWLNRFLSECGEEDRKSWASYIYSELGSLSENAKQNVWENWMREYWAQRLKGIPVPLSSEELKEMIEWTLELEPVFPPVVALICGGPSLDLGESLFYYRFVQKNLTESYPEAVADLLVHLLSGARNVLYQCDKLGEIAERLAKAGIPKYKLRAICDHLARLGYPQISELKKLLDGGH